MNVPAPGPMVSAMLEPAMSPESGDLQAARERDLQEETLRLRRELARGAAGARQLREALELAATYFQAPLLDEHDEESWQRIVAAVRSDAGRSHDERDERARLADTRDGLRVLVVEDDPETAAALTGWLLS